VSQSTTPTKNLYENAKVFEKLNKETIVNNGAGADLSNKKHKNHKDNNSTAVLRYQCNTENTEIDCYNGFSRPRHGSLESADTIESSFSMLAMIDRGRQVPPFIDTDLSSIGTDDFLTNRHVKVNRRKLSSPTSVAVLPFSPLTKTGVTIDSLNCFPLMDDDLGLGDVDVDVDVIFNGLQYPKQQLVNKSSYDGNGNGNRGLFLQASLL